jgi:hypothetical protein
VEPLLPWGFWSSKVRFVLCLVTFVKYCILECNKLLIAYPVTHMGWPGGEGLGPLSVLLSRSQVWILSGPLPVLGYRAKLWLQMVLSLQVDSGIVATMCWANPYRMSYYTANFVICGNVLISFYLFNNWLLVFKILLMLQGLVGSCTTMLSDFLLVKRWGDLIYLFTYLFNRNKDAVFWVSLIMKYEFFMYPNLYKYWGIKVFNKFAFWSP